MEGRNRWLEKVVVEEHQEWEVRETQSLVEVVKVGKDVKQ